MATHLPRILFFALIAILVWPSLAPAAMPAVLVNPHVKANGAAKTSEEGIDIIKTIQEGIDMVDPGGKVMVVPGTYDEALVINKGLTLEGVGGGSRLVIVAPSGAPDIAIEVATSEPVVIRDLTVRYGGANGIRGIGPVDLTVERVTVSAVNPPSGLGRLVSVVNNVVNNVPPSGRARFVVRESFLDGAILFERSLAPLFPQSFGVIVGGDVDAVLEGNVIRRTGGACIAIFVRNDLAGELNADILANDLDECYPLGRVGAILTGPAGTDVPSATRPLTATGVVNIVGNTIRNTTGSCLTTSAIFYEVYTGRIEHNRILDVVQDCASSSPRGFPAGIWVGSIRKFFPPVTPVVRFNDIVGNAQAGLRVAVAPDQTQPPPLDARCNWWGSPDGPSGEGPGSGDAVAKEGEAAMPPKSFTPWATAPIAATDATTCSGGE